MSRGCRPVRCAAGHVADLGDPVVGGAHEGADLLVVGVVEHGHDRRCVLERDLLGARLLLGHVVDAEELVVAEEQSVHLSSLFFHNKHLDRDSQTSCPKLLRMTKAKALCHLDNSNSSKQLDRDNQISCSEQNDQISCSSKVL